MRGWMDADIVSRLDDCWADFTTTSMGNAVSASVALFDELSHRTSRALALDAFDGGPVRGEIARIFRFTAMRD